MTSASNGLVFVEVTDEKPEIGKPYTDEKTGVTRPGRVRQTVWIHQGPHYPLKHTLTIDPDKSPYQPGLYLLAGEIFEASTNDYGGRKLPTLALKIRNLELSPAADIMQHAMLRPYLEQVAKSAVKAA